VNTEQNEVNGMKKGAVESSNTIIPTAINWRRQVSAWKGIRWRKQRYI